MFTMVKFKNFRNKILSIVQVALNNRILIFYFHVQVSIVRGMTDCRGMQASTQSSSTLWKRYIHKVLIFIEHHSVSPLVGIGTPPPLQPQASVPSPPDQWVGGHTRLRLKGWGSPNSDDWRKSLALCLLCGYIYTSVPEPELRIP